MAEDCTLTQWSCTYMYCQRHTRQTDSVIVKLQQALVYYTVSYLCKYLGTVDDVGILNITAVTL